MPTSFADGLALLALTAIVTTATLAGRLVWYGLTGR